MGPESYVKFSKIGALSADGSRPYADGANGFVMGEGAAIFLLKRLEDAERDGDKIYAVVRGIAGSSDGKGKGITAPNPSGQQKALERAWKDAGLSIQPGTLIEGHGTSTKVGDVTEVNSLQAVFGNLDLPKGSIALGSVKSNIGHLKSAAGAVGMMKVVLSLYHKVLPPSLNYSQPNPNIPFDNLPFRVNTESRSWDMKPSVIRRAGVSPLVLAEPIFMWYWKNTCRDAEGEKTVYAAPEPEYSADCNSARSGCTYSDWIGNYCRRYEFKLPGGRNQSVCTPGGKRKDRLSATEMLDMDLDLEADLGVDTVKQAELFATIRTHYGIPRKEDLRLSDYNTLNKVVQFVSRFEGDSIQSIAPLSGETSENQFRSKPVLEF